MMALPMIAQNIRNNVYYSTMAHEMTDVSNSNDLVANEDFIGLYEIDFIGSSLLRTNLPCYDGASNMSETKKDAEARAVYTPTASDIP